MQLWQGGFIFVVFKNSWLSFTFPKLHIYFHVFLECLNLLKNYSFSKSSHKNLWTCCCLSPFLSQFPKMGTTWHKSIHFCWRKAIGTNWWRKNQQQSKFVSVHFTKPFHKLNMSNLFVTFPTIWLTSCSVRLHSVASVYVSISYNWLQCSIYPITLLCAKQWLWVVGPSCLSTRNHDHTVIRVSHTVSYFANCISSYFSAITWL